MLAFRVYDSPAGGSALWAETKTEEADSSGVFSTLLGSVNPIEIDFTGPCWLEIEVDGEVMTPRREIVSVPFAYRAERADSAANAGEASNAIALGGRPAETFADSSVDGHSLDAADGTPEDALYVDDFGRVGVGTSTPATFLDVRTLGGAEGGVSPYAEVLGHFRTTGSDAHSAVSIDAQPGKDAILYFAQNGASMWDLRNDTDIGDKFQLRWHRAGTVRAVTVDTTGYVGILTTTPNGPLHVQSNISINSGTRLADRSAPLVVGDGDGANPCILIDGNQIEQSSAASVLHLNYTSPSKVSIAVGGGNVGIGTSSPDAKLEVAGQVKITGGSPGTGKVLASDAAGLASWEAMDVEYMVNPGDNALARVQGYLTQGYYQGYYVIVADDPPTSASLMIPVHIQSRVGGVPQRIKSLRVYYKVCSGSGIYATWIMMMDNVGADTAVIGDTTERTSTAWGSYTVTDPSPDLITGVVTVRLDMSFDGANCVDIQSIVLTTGP